MTLKWRRNITVKLLSCFRAQMLGLQDVVLRSLFSLIKLSPTSSTYKHLGTAISKTIKIIKRRKVIKSHRVSKLGLQKLSVCVFFAGLH